MVQIGSQAILYIVLSMCYFLANDSGKGMSGLVLSFELCLEKNKDNIYPPKKGIYQYHVSDHLSSWVAMGLYQKGIVWGFNLDYCVWFCVCRCWWWSKRRLNGRKTAPRRLWYRLDRFRWMILNRMVHSENSPIRMRLKNLVTQIGGLMTAINIPHIQPMATVWHVR
jgi:hypothetical protein